MMPVNNPLAVAVQSTTRSNIYEILYHELYEKPDIQKSLFYYTC